MGQNNLKATPLVSVVIPTYNRRELVQLAIDSVLAQTFKDFEVIVVDDGSQDGTGEALSRYGKQIHYSYQQNQGESVARNRAIGLARGKYIALLDSDDLWLPEKLEQQVPVLEQNPEICLVFCQAWLINLQGDRFNLPPLGAELQPPAYSLRGLLMSNSVIAGGSTAMIRSSTLETVEGFNHQIRFGEDWDLWLRLRARWEFAFVPQPLVYIRRHRTTQCHLPRPEQIERKLQDHLSLLTGAFDAYPAPGADLAMLRNRSIARQYAEAAFASYAWEHCSRGLKWLRRASSLDPDTWRDPTTVSEMLIRHGAAIIELDEKVDLDRLRHYVESTLEYLPQDIDLSPSLRRQILGRLCAEAGYRNYLASEYGKAREFMWQALKTDAALWQDRGLVKRLLITFLPGRMHNQHI